MTFFICDRGIGAGPLKRVMLSASDIKGIILDKSSKEGVIRSKYALIKVIGNGITTSSASSFLSLTPINVKRGRV